MSVDALVGFNSHNESQKNLTFRNTVLRVPDSLRIMETAQRNFIIFVLMCRTATDKTDHSGHQFHTRFTFRWRSQFHYPPRTAPPFLPELLRYFVSPRSIH